MKQILAILTGITAFITTIYPAGIIVTIVFFFATLDLIINEN